MDENTIYTETGSVKAYLTDVYPMSDEPHSFGAVMLALVEAYRNGITEIEKTKYRYAETVNAIK